MLNLPDGARLLPAHSVSPAKGPPTPAVPKERFVARTNNFHIRIVAQKDATPMPRMGRVVVCPIRDNSLHTPIVVKEIPVMIVKGAAKSSQSESG